MAETKSDKVRVSYRFLREREEAGATFSVTELEAVTGWKRKTISKYLWNKWRQFVHKGANGLRADSGHRDHRDRRIVITPIGSS